MRIIRLVAERARRREGRLGVTGRTRSTVRWRAASGETRARRAGCRSGSGSIWWAALGVAMVVFYVVLTPIWLGLRALPGWPSCGSRL